jgi:hypothetical protein
LKHLDGLRISHEEHDVAVLCLVREAAKDILYVYARQESDRQVSKSSSGIALNFCPHRASTALISLEHSNATKRSGMKTNIRRGCVWHRSFFATVVALVKKTSKRPRPCFFGGGPTKRERFSK